MFLTELLASLSYYLFLSLGINYLLFTIAFWFRTDKLTDLSYGMTFFYLCLVAFLSESYTMAGLVIFSLIALWSFRIAGYLFYRVLILGEDKRFTHIRSNFKSFFGFWTLQGLSIFIISICHLLFFQSDTNEIRYLFWIGAFISIFGLIIETVADFQKFKFKKSNPTAFMQLGLWKKVRHVNYSGEILFWIGIWLSCFSYIESYKWLSLISPLFVMVLLIKVSGIPILDKTWKEKYGSDNRFQKYYESSYKLIPYIY